MKSKYLREINCEYNFDDERKPMFEKEREEYGIASYDTWNIDISFVEFLYIIFKMYDEKNIIDTHYVHLDIENEQWDLQQAIDYIISSCKNYLIHRKKDFLAQEELSDMFFLVLKKVLPYMWW